MIYNSAMQFPFCIFYKAKFRLHSQTLHHMSDLVLHVHIWADITKRSILWKSANKRHFSNGGSERNKWKRMSLIRSHIKSVSTWSEREEEEAEGEDGEGEVKEEGWRLHSDASRRDSTRLLTMRQRHSSALLPTEKTIYQQAPGSLPWCHRDLRWPFCTFRLHFLKRIGRGKCVRTGL